MAASLHIGQDCSRDSAHPAGKCQGVFRSLQGRQFFAQNSNGGVVAPAVDMVAQFIGKGLPELIQRVKGEVAGLNDRGRNVIEILRSFFTQVGKDFTEMHLLFTPNLGKIPPISPMEQICVAAAVAMSGEPGLPEPHPRRSSGQLAHKPTAGGHHSGKSGQAGNQFIFPGFITSIVFHKYPRV